MCIVQVSRDMAVQLARGIDKLRGKISPKTKIVGTSVAQKLLLHKELKKLNIKTKVANEAKDLGIGRSGGHRRIIFGIPTGRKLQKAERIG